MADPASHLGPRPIFLHSGYRSGSTWFWHRFRECAGVYAYCEPFNVKLGFLAPAEIAGNRSDVWPSGHPAHMRPYYEEYEPLLAPRGGVVLYEPRFGVETYFKTEPDPAMARYIALLVDHAQDQGKLPVLGFCCSMGRVEWFRRFIDGWNVVTWRNPRDQWDSCHRQWVEHGNFHFEAHNLLVAYISRLFPGMAPFFDGLGPVPPPNAIVPTMPLFTKPDGVATRFRVFLRVFVLDTLLSVQNADLVVDLDAMSGTPAYRADVTARLRALSGLADLSFDDCLLPRHAFGGEADYPRLLREELAYLNAFAVSPGAVAFGKSLPFLRSRLAELIAADAKP